jgi:hypothetical protein
MDPLRATSTGLILLIILSKRPSPRSAAEEFDVSDVEIWVLPPAPDGGAPPRDTAPPPLNPLGPTSDGFGEAARVEDPDE